MGSVEGNCGGDCLINICVLNVNLTLTHHVYWHFSISRSASTNGKNNPMKKKMYSSITISQHYRENKVY